MMKLPFHTTAKSTARLLISIPSYWYCGERAEALATELLYRSGSGTLWVSQGTGGRAGKKPVNSGSLWAERAAEGQSDEPYYAAQLSLWPTVLTPSL